MLGVGFGTDRLIFGRDGDYEMIEGEDVNGEVVRDGMENWKGRMRVRGGVWGIGWAMCVLGIWGDRS